MVGGWKWNISAARQAKTRLISLIAGSKISGPNYTPWGIDKSGVPEISRFFGIIIRMFMEAGAAHRAPHFHASCQEHRRRLQPRPVELMAGELPRTQRRLV
jgi:hypothetical protein